MQILSEELPDRAWPIPGHEGGIFHHRVATSFDVDVANAIASEIAREFISGGQILGELGLGSQHVTRYADALGESPDMSIGSTAGQYGSFFQAIALGEVCGIRFEGIGLSKDALLEPIRPHLAKLFKNRSIRVLWMAEVLGIEVKAAQAGNVSAAAPSGVSALAGNTVKTADS